MTPWQYDEFFKDIMRMHFRNFSKALDDLRNYRCGYYITNDKT